MQERTRGSFSKYTGSEVPLQGSANTGCMKSGELMLNEVPKACGTSFLSHRKHCWARYISKIEAVEPTVMPAAARGPRHSADVSSASMPGVSSASSATISEKVFM